MVYGAILEREEEEKPESGQWPKKRHLSPQKERGRRLRLRSFSFFSSREEKDVSEVGVIKGSARAFHNVSFIRVFTRFEVHSSST